MAETLKFSIDSINLLEDISDAQLAIAEVWVCHNGDNLHNFPITEEALTNAIPTLYNKFIVAGLQNGDFMGHEGKNQLILGFFPKENNVRFAEKDGKQYIVANAIISKIYAEWAYDILSSDNYREVSMEIIIVDTKMIDNEEWINAFVFMGVTVLGLDWTAACPGSNVQITKFSTDQLIEQGEKVYHQFCVDNFAKDLEWDIPNEIKVNAVKGMEYKNKYGYGGNSVSMSFARYVVKNDTITETKAKNYLKYFPKNEKDLSFSEPPEKEYINFMLFGGGDGRAWMAQINSDIQEKKTKLNNYFDSIDKVYDDKSNILLTQNKDTLEMGKEEENTEMANENMNFTELTYRNKIEIVNKYVRDEMGYRYWVSDISDTFVILYDENENFYYKVPYSITDGNVNIDIANKVAVVNAWTEEFSSNKNTEGEQSMELEKVTNTEDLANAEFAESEKKDETSEKEEDMDCKEEMASENTADKETDDEEKDEDKKDAEKEEDMACKEEMASDEKEEDAEKKDEEEMACKEEMSADSDEEKEEEKSDEEDSKATMSVEELEQKCCALEKENTELKASVDELTQFKASVEKEQRDNIVFATIFDVKEKCPTMPQDEVDALKEEAEMFSLDKIEDWKNMVYSKAFIFSTGVNETKTTYTKIGLPFSKEVKTKKGLWD